MRKRTQMGEFAALHTVSVSLPPPSEPFQKPPSVARETVGGRAHAGRPPRRIYGERRD